MAYRRGRRSGFRLQLPRQFRNYRPNVGEGNGIYHVTAMFLMVFVSLVVYTGFLLPGINDLECGVDYATEFEAWVYGLDPNTHITSRAARTPEEMAYDDALRIKNDDARLAAFKAITPPTIRGRPASPKFPECKGTIPTGETHHRAYEVLVTFMPFLVLILLLFLIVKQSGSISMFPALMFALIIRELIPGDGIIDWVVMVVGITIACIPIPVGGLLAALSHVGALALWPTMILAYTAATGDAGAAITPAVEQIFEFVVWVMPIGILIFSPLVWQMRASGAARD